MRIPEPNITSHFRKSFSSTLITTTGVRAILITSFLFFCFVLAFGQSAKRAPYRQLTNHSAPDTACIDKLYDYGETLRLTGDSAIYHRMMVLQALGDCYAGTHRYALAQKNYASALVSAITTGDKIKQMELYRALAVCLEETGNLPEAIMNQKSHLMLRDSIRQEEHRKEIVVLEAHYRSEKQQRMQAEKNLVIEQEKSRAMMRSSWLIGGAMLLIAATVFVRQQVRIMSAREEKLKTERQVHALQAGEHERNRIAKDLHDDVGATLSSIHIYSQAAQIQWKEKPEAVHHLITRIGSNSFRMMDKMNDIIWSMSVHRDPTEALTTRVKNFATEVLRSLDIQPVFSCEILPSLRFTMEARKNLLLIFKEAVRNIALHSEAKEASMSLKTEGADFVMVVIDDGIGFDPQDQISGDGLVTMKHRAAMLEGELTVQSSGENGTSIVLRVPLSKISTS